MKSREEMDKIMKEMKNAKCSWPECKEKSIIHTSLQLLTIKDGKPVPVQNMSLPTPLCMHHMFVTSSGMFAILEDENKKHSLIGPVEFVKLIETVINSMILTGKFRELIQNSKLLKTTLSDSNICSIMFKKYSFKI